MPLFDAFLHTGFCYYRWRRRQSARLLPHDHGGDLVPDDPELEGLAAAGSGMRQLAKLASPHLRGRFSNIFEMIAMKRRRTN